jgi:magnesium-protoporphyrin O-methyltransferase
MLDPALGEFDHVVAMDSLIHYDAADIVRVLGGAGARAPRSMLFTFAPRTPAAGVMHAVGRLFPARRPRAGDRAGGRARLRRARADPALPAGAARTQRVASGFYTSQALELVRA